MVDTWWQTETGPIMISPLLGVTSGKPGAAMKPLRGIVADVVDDSGQSVPDGGGGFLVIKEPWPSMLRTIWRPGRAAPQARIRPAARRPA